MRAGLSEAAKADFLDALRWIARENPAAAKALREALRAASASIADHPRIGYVNRTLAAEPIRFLPLSGFPYLLVYDSAARPPLVLRVLHGARDLPDLLAEL